MPNMGLELLTLRSRVTFSANWASQAPQYDPISSLKHKDCFLESFSFMVRGTDMSPFPLHFFLELECNSWSYGNCFIILSE